MSFRTLTLTFFERLLSLMKLFSSFWLMAERKLDLEEDLLRDDEELEERLWRLPADSERFLLR